ncbi:MAG: ABC transporter permease, partial [Acidobacteria bacterium]|nr:ABC transporter permease [Acidobacteriota bacterium]
MWRNIGGWFGTIFRRDEFEGDLSEELKFHLRSHADVLEQRGFSREEAMRQARVALGNPTTIRQDVRDSRFGAWMGPVMQDLHYGLRVLCKRPGVAIPGVVSLAIGMGVCTFFFSQFNAMVLRPLPAAHSPQALVATSELFSYPVLERFRELEIADGAAAYVGPVPFNVAFENQPGLESSGVRTFGHVVSPNYFSVLRVAPAAGRFFSSEIEGVGSAAAVVISDSFWNRRMNGDPAAVGRTLRINGHGATIVGIAPPEFRGVFPVNPADLFVPATTGATIAPELQGDTLEDPEANRFHVVLRLAGGVSLAGAEVALDPVARTGNADGAAYIADAAHREGRQVTLLRAGRVGRLTTEQLWMVVGLNGLLVALVLSLACANLAGLLVARTRDREREM